MLILCRHCSFRLLVVDDPEVVDEYFAADAGCDDRYRCPQCKAIPTFGAEDDGEFTPSRSTMSAHNAHLVLMGMGLPHERVCTAEVVRALFKKQGVIVEAVDIPDTERCIIKSFTFEDGAILDISSGGYGPTAHKIRRPHGQEDRSLLQEAEGGSSGGVPVPGEADGS